MMIMMMNSRSGLFFAILALTVAIGSAKQQYNEKCETGIEPTTKAVLDNCDEELYLTCRDSRCECMDRANQIWAYALVKANSRSKRGSKGFKSKAKVAGAALAGAAAGTIIGNKIAKAGSSSSNNNDKYVKKWSCYSRAEGQCFLKGGDKPNVLVQYHIHSAASTSAGNSSDNSTTTTASPVIDPAHINVTQTRYPPCVPNALCKKPELKIVNGTVISGFVNDARLGRCECISGYKANGQDICVKSGAGRSEIGLTLVISLIVSLMWQKTS